VRSGALAGAAGVDLPNLEPTSLEPRSA